ncbi:MAG: hypothetical protein M1818_006633 [Claussenomyces sp. TS43310]|nr:MAG: hypothetical protein M1818_006933 [Claussenomyces sp. TS43310]KAI9735056.1 MAG: hypothetical protein M1818_006633 [Claussenomyces sp. TS43310]
MYTKLDDRSESDVQSEDCEALLPDDSDSPCRLFSRTSPFCYLPVGIAIISIALVAFGAMIGSRWLVDNDLSCAEHGQQYSPILDEVDASYHIVRFNGSLLKDNVFRQNAGPEVDAAWDSLGVNYRSLRLPEREAKRSGLRPDQVKINHEYGGGYPVNIEGLHHLHCLDLVRQSLYYNYDYYHSRATGAFSNDDNIVYHHVYIIRQRLMCDPDTGVLGQVWVFPNAPEAFVDFNTEHKCKNFDAIRQWAEERQLPLGVPSDFLQPPREGDTIYEAIP